MAVRAQIPLFRAQDEMLARAEHAPACELRRRGLAGNDDWVCECDGQTPAPYVPRPGVVEFR
ncbi:hypothetical protein ACWGJ9_09330 [Curtobacterium citreum]